MTAFVVMGICGCGKTEIGTRLAEAICGTFLEGDSYHSAASVEKMAAGIPLDDDDRWPWLDRITDAMRDARPPVVVACSALKKAYRDRIAAGAGDAVHFIHLSGERDLVASRMASRQGHYMPLDLIDSQLAALEPPGTDEHATTLNIDQSVDDMLETILNAIRKDLE